MSKIYVFLKRILPKGKYRARLKTAFMYCCRVFPIDKEKVVFISYYGKGYDDNPKSIFLEFVKRNPRWHYIWILKDTGKIISDAKVVQAGSLSALFHLATARMWIDNCRKDSWITKRKNQYYVQTWHGNVAIKKVEKDAEGSLPEWYVLNAQADSKMADLFISGTKWRTQNYRDAFWYEGEVLEVGYPYSDVLYGKREEMHKRICEYFSLAETDKLCVYAPTFRNDGNLECYNMDYERVLAALKQRWGGEWKMLIRLHPNIREKHNDLVYSADKLDASVYEEMPELVMGADFVISDYSSVLIDAIEAKTKGLIYASDYEEYNKDRSLYFGKEELPYAFCETNSQVIEIIKSFDETEYEEKRKIFYDRVGFYNDEHSTERVVDEILRRIQ